MKKKYIFFFTYFFFFKKKVKKKSGKKNWGFFFGLVCFCFFFRKMESKKKSQKRNCEVCDYSEQDFEKNTKDINIGTNIKVRVIEKRNRKQAIASCSSERNEKNTREEYEKHVRSALIPHSSCLQNLIVCLRRLKKEKRGIDIEDLHDLANKFACTISQGYQRGEYAFIPYTKTGKCSIVVKRAHNTEKNANEAAECSNEYEQTVADVGKIEIARIF